MCSASGSRHQMSPQPTSVLPPHPPLLASSLSLRPLSKYLIRRTTLTTCASDFPSRSTLYPWWLCRVLQEGESSALYQWAPLSSSFLLCSAKEGAIRRTKERIRVRSMHFFLPRFIPVVSVLPSNHDLFSLFHPSPPPLPPPESHDWKAVVTTTSRTLLVEVAWPEVLINWPQIAAVVTGPNLWWTDRPKKKKKNPVSCF